MLYAIFLVPTEHSAHENLASHRHEGFINAKINWKNYDSMGAEIPCKPHV